VRARELREETGLDLPLTPTDSGSPEWPHLLASAPLDARVVIDAEHDRFEWCPAEVAPERCQPDLTRLLLRAVLQRIARPAPFEGGAFYDDVGVFTTYMHHRQWSANPNDTIAEPVFLELLGDVRNKRALDLGCGDGRFGRYLLDAGALSYLGRGCVNQDGGTGRTIAALLHAARAHRRIRRASVQRGSG
jgi:hypothetical protein